MPGSLAVGDILACRAWLQLDEQGAVNTYNFVVTSNTGTGGTDQDLATAFDTSVGPFYQSLIPVTVTYRGIQVYWLKHIGLLTVAAPVQSIASSGVGTASGNPLPRNAAPILKYNDGLRGPAHRGRLFFPFVSTLYSANNGRPTTALATALNAFSASLMAPYTVGTSPNQSTLQWCIIQKHKGAVPTVRGNILFADSANKFGTMHKRGDYGRPNASPI